MYEFVRQAWQWFEPVEPYREGWHVGAVCEHLEAVARGQIQNLLIEIGPGYAKSLLAAVAWPAWVWTWRPEWQSIFCSYSGKLSKRDSMRCRYLIESPWYRERFGGRWDLRDDSNRQDDYSNTLGGRRLSSSVDGTNTGERGHCIVGDDLLSAKDAESEAARTEAWDFWSRVMPTRLNDKERDSRVVIGQRLHRHDPQGRIREAGGYEVLCLPTEYVPKRSFVTFRRLLGPDGRPVRGEDGKEVREEFRRDRRKVAGELLFEALFPAHVCEAIKGPNDLGPSGFQTQHNQDPGDAESGKFKRGLWRFWKRDGDPDLSHLRPEGCWKGPAVVLPKRFDEECLSLDAAFDSPEDGSFVVLTAWGAVDARRFLLERWRKHAEFEDTKTELLRMSKARPSARRKYVEKKANGAAIINSLSGKVAGLVPVNPEGGKEARAAVMLPWVESGCVFLPDGAPWLEEWVDEFARFPGGPNDDQVDSATQAISKMETSSAAVDRMRVLADEDE